MSTAIRRMGPAVVVAGLATGLVVRFDTVLAGDSVPDPAAPGAEQQVGAAGPDQVEQDGTAAPAVEPGTAVEPESAEEPGAEEPGTAEEPETDTGSIEGPVAEADPDACEGVLVTGPVVPTEWGPLQVEAEVDDGVVCSATAVVSPAGDRRSLQINAEVLPVIDARVAESGDASFDVVTGATVTSEGYRSSLQAILDQT